MKKVTYQWNRNTACWAGVLFYAVCGLLLLILPKLAMSIANFSLAAILLIVGGFFVFSYFKGSVLDGLMGARLMMGLVLVCFGIMLCFNSSFLSVLLPLLWGISLLVGGFGKVQICIDLKRIGEKYWWTVLIGAVVSFALGFIAIARPSFITTIVTQFIGISLLVEAVLDAITLFTTNKRVKDYRKNCSNPTAM
ncbi:MAG: DUF308 domain-containing protein [Clostridia bacterium]